MDAAVAPAWQHNQPIETLRALARPFAAMHKPLVYGAFGLTKERDIAPALAEHRALWTGDPPEAVLLFHRLKHQSTHTDFTGRAIPLTAPAILVSAFAAIDVTSSIKLLAALVARAPNERIYLEIFEEDATARIAADRLGFRYIATKIAAGSEIKGLYVRGEGAANVAPLPPEEAVSLAIIDPDFLSSEHYAAICSELAAQAPWQQHYSSYNKRHSWTSFALRGYADDPGFIIKPHEMSQRWKADHPKEMLARPRWTTAAPAFPRTRARLDAIGCDFDRVRFMRLAAKGGELTRHADITDREAGLADGRIARLHVPIATSDAVTFNGWTERGAKVTAHWPAGALCYLDQRKPHAVQNTDPKLDRIHLVIDVVADARLRGMIRAAVHA